MVLIFGGAFNPPTLAHAQIIEKLHQKLLPERFIIVPVGNHYDKLDLVDFDHRFRMLKIMIDSFSFDITVSDFEKIPPFKGTYEMLMYFKKKYEDIAFVVGSDHLKQLSSWIKYEKLLKKFYFVIITRSGYQVDTTLLDSHHAQYEIFTYDSDISSTKIRHDVDNYRHVLNDKVYTYIRKNHLYEE